MSTIPQGEGAVKRTPFLMIVTIVLVCLLGLCVLVSGGTVAWLLPASQAARDAAQGHACRNNLKLIGIALQNYHDKYRRFPPAHVADADGKPMHSWRVLLLPFLRDGDARSVCNQYDFDEPWNGPNNSQLAGQGSRIYRCPSGTDASNKTSYVAVVGPATAWPGATAMRTRDILDGMSQTIMVIEVSGSGINWMEPRDLTVDQALAGINPPGAKPNISSDHRIGAHVLFVDSHVRFLPNDFPASKLRALLTAAGREPVDMSD